MNFGLHVIVFYNILLQLVDIALSNKLLHKDIKIITYKGHSVIKENNNILPLILNQLIFTYSNHQCLPSKTGYVSPWI